MIKLFKKIFISLLLSIVLNSVLFAKDADRFISFTKIEYDCEENVFIRSKDYDKQYQTNMIKVLDFFGYKYKLLKDELFITIELDSDIQYLWNLCNKASDTKWLSSRKL